MTEPTGYAISVEADCIVVRHGGELTVQEIEASRRAVAELVEERHVTSILLDLSWASTGLTTEDIYELCREQGSTLPAGSAVAVVYRPGQFSMEDAWLAETVSLTRDGLLRAFTDIETAQRWLLQDSQA